MRFVPLYGGSLQVPGSLDHRRLVGEHIHCPACSGGSCPPVGVLIMSGPRLSHREHICRPAHSGGSCPPVGVLIASGTRLSCHLSSCSFQRFVPSNGGSLRVLGDPSHHHWGMCLSRRSSSHSFCRFLPSCGGSLGVLGGLGRYRLVRNTFIMSFIVSLVPLHHLAFFVCIKCIVSTQMITNKLTLLQCIINLV